MRNEKEIGKIIKELRGELSLRDFAQKCDISHTTIDNLEKGIDYRTGKPTQVKVATLQKIADACNVTLSYITGDNEGENILEKTSLALFGRSDAMTLNMFEDAINNIRRILSERDKIDKHTPKRLRDTIELRKITIEKLSEITKVDSYTIGNFLDGKLKIDDEILRLFAIALDVSVEYLKCQTNALGKGPIPKNYFEGLVTKQIYQNDSNNTKTSVDDEDLFEHR